jgi:hypothetical protein
LGDAKVEVDEGVAGHDQSRAKSGAIEPTQGNAGPEADETGQPRRAAKNMLGLAHAHTSGARRASGYWI